MAVRAGNGFSLPADGDSVEQHYWSRFIGICFPSYAQFWADAIVSVTRRVIDRRDIRFLSDAELAAAGKSHEDVVIAQLHYTVMIHLGRAHDLMSVPVDRWTFAEIFVRLTGASDCADELLERVTTPGKYDPWSEDAGRHARNRWRSVHGRPLQDIHAYRNRIVHGRVVPEIIANVQRKGEDTGERVFIYPRTDRVDDFLDWRKAFSDTDSILEKGDFASGQAIARDAWLRVVAYCEEKWKEHLLKPVS